jgi:hypothetical protein
VPRPRIAGRRRLTKEDIHSRFGGNSFSTQEPTGSIFTRRRFLRAQCGILQCLEAGS